LFLNTSSNQFDAGGSGEYLSASDHFRVADNLSETLVIISQNPVMENHLRLHRYECNPVVEWPVHSDGGLGGDCVEVLKEVAVSMRIRPFTLACGVMIMLGLVRHAVAQDDGALQPSARQQLQHIHTAQSIDQKLTQLTKDLELTPQQQEKVRPLLEEHHDKIQALLDKNPTKSRRALGPQIHAISDETHRQIHALLTDHQKELEKAMLHHEHNGEEHR
jgi:periplasmic protein CpxP/Spy